MHLSTVPFHLPSPQFARLVTLLAIDPSDPALDSMILAWDHIATRLINLNTSNRVVIGKIESIRLLAIHDALHTVFDTGSGYLYHGNSANSSVAAALAATAHASHLILAWIFDSSADRAMLADALEESLSLIRDGQDKTSGAVAGAESAAAFMLTFAPLELNRQLSETASEHQRDTRRSATGWALQPSGSRTEDPNCHPTWRRSA